MSKYRAVLISWVFAQTAMALHSGEVLLLGGTNTNSLVKAELDGSSGQRSTAGSPNVTPSNGSVILGPQRQFVGEYRKITQWSAPITNSTLDRGGRL